MTIEVNFIEGAAGGRRLNACFSVVTEGNEGRLTDVIDFIPVCELPRGKTGEDIRAAFLAASTEHQDRRNVVTQARKILGLDL